MAKEMAIEKKCVIKPYKMERIRKSRKLRNNEYYGTQEIFDKLYENSGNGKTFNDLFNIIIDDRILKLAFRNIKTNTGSKTCGTDGLTIKDIKRLDEEEYLNKIKKRLKWFQPQPVRRVEIPKGNGKMRPLGIPTMEDRLIQEAIKIVLDPIVEAKFHHRSYGFRPNRGAHQAIAKCYQMIQRQHLHYVVDIDIKGFFDNVDHSKLIKQLWSLGIQDKKLICIISCMLKAPIEGIGIPTKGTPQGGILSPLLSNVVLNELDWWIDSQWENMKTEHNYKSFRKNCVDNSNHYKVLRRTKLKEVYIVRYADDFKIFCRKPEDAQKIFIATKMWLKERLNLEISEEKSKITNLKRKYTEFLGFKIKLKPKEDKYVVVSHMSDKAKQKTIENLKEHIKRIGKSKQKNYDVNLLNSKILGAHNYYKPATDVCKDFVEIDFKIRKTLNARFGVDINKTRGKPSKTYKKFYKDYKKIRYLFGIELYPIYGVKHENPMNFRIGVCNYTEDGRKLIHNKLQTIDTKIIEIMLANPVPNRSILYNDNRISLYVGQRGRCSITGNLLRIGQMECHHIVPLSMGGSDEYGNLTFVISDVHKLIHATEDETVKKYLKEIGLTKEMINTVNLLRAKVGNYEIQLT